LLARDFSAESVHALRLRLGARDCVGFAQNARSCFRLVLSGTAIIEVAPHERLVARAGISC